MTELFRANDERAPNERPVATVAPQHLTVATARGRGTVPLFATGEWNEPQPGVGRAVILIHGRLRNADAYYQLAHRARARAGHDSTDTLLIVPQFLAQADVDAHRLPASTLRWEWTNWMGGGDALGPAPFSSFDVVDALLAVLADPVRFPALNEVVIAGHSGGGQVAQRYAVLARGEAPLVARGIALRYVIANPSSYVYFDARRPDADGGFSEYDAARCEHFNRWKYGLEDLPEYASVDGVAPSAHALEDAYARRDVTVLLGSDDCDPAHPALDRSCAAMAQGEHRLGRGQAYARYMRERHPEGLVHRTYEVAGAGHDADAVFGSPAGMAALFGGAA
ncbi:alpha/beta fold hydrolase [Paraburkholderia caballeronis]|uniref:Alpha/beta hydrolase family protein n=1 Tax=Paraburkholderia caballeronis TaxID=416943 RepID=A0A1H7TUF2_9BURK|nr:alpha/beta fold hydrolase [Paraburkholderia caballeronis]PXW17664.1 alpha/beta hydrolase family protein [Paraburkholderia caballeronis]PXW95409.1 alpha/beta hydrolase family protein [Paraburkholderia caballeronis]RAJ91223.1 alpha/beta hydrolase family protein [Paraburkholderia caballeronis]SEE12129.1 Alpha/beta hydrolase family protein [Paraburkholderia caballeronis]SEL88361.1 Alpha/beta hydrolase family protein [Paraburkholderia caballeronis]